MKKLTYITLLGFALISLSACNTPTNSNKNTKTENSTKKLNNSTNQQAHTTKENKVEEQKEIDAKPATKTTEQTAAPNINITNNDGANTKNNLVDTIKTKNRKQYVEYFNSTNETSVNGMKDIEELVNDQSKDFDVTIIVAPGINGEKTKEEFMFDMNGKSVLKLSKNKALKMVDDFLKKNEMKITDIDMVIPHQASHALELMMKKLGVKKGKYIDIFKDYGNMVSASVPFTLCWAFENGKIKKGDIVMLSGTAAGLTTNLLLMKI